MRKRSLRTILALFFILFALADISFAGGCCSEETNTGSQTDTTCFCCCSHVTVENYLDFVVEYESQFMPSSNVRTIIFSSQTIIYHPPKTI